MLARRARASLSISFSSSSKSIVSGRAGLDSGSGSSSPGLEDVSGIVLIGDFERHTVTVEHRPHWEQLPLHPQVLQARARRFREPPPRPEVSDSAQDIGSRCVQRWERWSAIALALASQDVEASHPPRATTRPCEYRDPTILSSAPCIAWGSSVQGEMILGPIG